MKQLFTLFLALFSFVNAQTSGTSRTVRTTVPLLGTGTTTNPIRLSPCGTIGQGLAWNGSAWVCTSPTLATNFDFWRSGVGATILPDGTNDLTENVRRNGSVGINTDPLATHHVNGTSIIGGTGNIQASKLHVQQGSGNIGLPTALFDLNNCGTPCAQVVGSNVMLRNNNSTSPDNGGAITWANASTTTIGAGIRGWNRTASGMGLSFMTNGENPRMTINGIGHVGINTSSQHSFLDSRGSFSTIVAFSGDNTALPLTVNHHKIELGGTVTAKNIQLPNANTCNGREYIIYFTGDSPLTASATITAPTAQIGDPSLNVGMLSSLPIARNGLRSVSLTSDGTNWHVSNALYNTVASGAASPAFRGVLADATAANAVTSKLANDTAVITNSSTISGGVLNRRCDAYWNGTAWICTRTDKLEIEGAIRINASGNWEALIDGQHQPTNVTSVANNTSPSYDFGFTITHPATQKVGTALVTKDDMWTTVPAHRMELGSSSGLTTTTVQMVLSDISGYISWNGTQWTITPTGDVFLDTDYTITDDGTKITVTHPAFFGSPVQQNIVSAQLQMNTGVPFGMGVRVTGLTANSFQIYLLNGNSWVTPPNIAGARIFFERKGIINDPALIRQRVGAQFATNNVWFTAKHQ